MAETFTHAEIKAYLRDEVQNAGGAKKWLRRNKIFGYDHILHMVANGDAATLLLDQLGFEPVTLYVAKPRPTQDRGD